MSQYVTLTIDGAKIRAPRGTTVLDAALDYGICIPALCHMRDVTPLGACRICIVELVKNGKSKVTTSCTLEVEEGMVVLAHSPKILKARKNLAELLVAEAPNSKAIQDIAVRCGVKKVRYPFRHKNCVLCGKCVRVCKEIWQSESLGFVGRGKNRHVALPYNTRPDYCKRCNYCVDVCPMTIVPCPGSMKPGQEFLCGQCESQLTMAANAPDTCVMCELGAGFGCSRRHL